MIITHKITLNLDRRGDTPILDAVQGDSAREVEFFLKMHGKPWAVPADTTAMIQYRRVGMDSGGVFDTLPDGDCAYSLGDNTVTVQLPAQALGKPGMVELQVTLVQGGSEITFFTVLIRVQENLSDTLVTEEDYKNLSQQIRTEVGAAIEAMDPAKIHWVVVSKQADGGYAADRTFADIYAAIMDMRSVVCILRAVGDLHLNLIERQTDWVMFAGVYDDYHYTVTITEDEVAVDMERVGGNGEAAALPALVGTTKDITPAQALEAIRCGKDIVLTHTDGIYGAVTVNWVTYIAAFGSVMSAVATKVGNVCYIIQLWGNLSSGEWTSGVVQQPTMNDIPVKLSQLENDVGFLTAAPTRLPNPYALTINGQRYDGSEAVEIAVAGEAETETVLSDNLFDKSAAVPGQLFYYGASGCQLVSGGDSYYAYVPLRGAGTYRTKIDNSQHASTDGRIAILKADHTFLQSVTGQVTETENNYAFDIEFTVTAEMITAGAAEIAFDCHKTVVNTVMVVKDRAYPPEYIPYGYIEVPTDSGKKQDNALCGKMAVFLGDSICAGTTVGDGIPEYGYGWAGLIGEANQMTWRNFGANGGTVTSLETVQESRWLTTQADAAVAAYPNADYVIFEGGCNDADQMKDALLGEISADYTTFDTATFSGAFESLILKLVTAYPNAKIGYIIPQKMYAQNDHTAAGHVHRRFFDRAIEICEKWGIPYIDLWKSSPLNPKLSTAGRFYTDGQHLTLAGYQRIVPQIEAFMRNI